MPIYQEEPLIEPANIVDSTGANIASVSVAGALKIDGSSVTQPISGTITVGNSTLAVTQSGIWNISNISGTISLPTGAATSALQITANNTLAAIDAGIPTALGQTTMATSMPVVIASNQSPIPVSISTSSVASTYSATSGTFTPGSTPTDIMTLTGSGTKIIRILRLELSATQTTLGMNTWYLVKRSTANSGGTSTTKIIVPFDSTNAAATATMRAYTANPTTLGTLIGNISSIKLVCAPTVGGTPTQDYWGYDFTNSGTQQGLVLHGTSELFALNFNGAALPTGLSINVNIMWSEE